MSSRCVVMMLDDVYLHPIPSLYIIGSGSRCYVLRDVNFKIFSSLVRSLLGWLRAVLRACCFIGRQFGHNCC